MGPLGRLMHLNVTGFVVSYVVRELYATLSFYNIFCCTLPTSK